MQYTYCRLLAGEGRGNLQICCPQFCNVNQLPRRSHRLHSWDPAEHLRFVNPCNFKTLDKFRRSWLVSAVNLWNDLPADVLLQGRDTWMACHIERYTALYLYIMLILRSITVKKNT